MTHIVSMLISGTARPWLSVTFAPKNVANLHWLSIAREFDLDFVHEKNSRF